MENKKGVGSWISKNDKLFIFLIFVVFTALTMGASVAIAYAANVEATKILFPVLTGWAGTFVGWIIKAAADFGLDGKADTETKE